MPNPFDQFDEPEENPFDEFDSAGGGVFSHIKDMGDGMTVEGIDGAVNQRREDVIGQYANRNKFGDERWQAIRGSGSDQDVADLERQIGTEAAESEDFKPLDPQKMSRAQAFTVSMIQSGMEIPGIGHAVYGGMGALTGESPKDLRQMTRAAKKDAREDHPMTSLGGDLASYLAPGNAVFQGTRAVGQGLARQIPRALTPQGASVAARLGRYAPVVAGTATASAVDYGVYNSTVEAGNVAADEEREITPGERTEMFKEGVTDPLAWTVGGAMSPLYRAARGTVTGVKNTAQATKKAGKFTPKAGSLTPKHRAEWASSVMEAGAPANRAYEMVAKRLQQDGITAEQLNTAIDNYAYAGYSSVEEMIFEIAAAATKNKGGGKIKQLAVALGSVGGDAQQTARSAFRERAVGSPARIREELRRAAGIEGSDFYQYADELNAARRELPKDLYDSAYGKSVTDEAWADKLVPLFKTSPSARKALDEASGYASDRGELAVAREIDDLLQWMSSKSAPSKVGSLPSAGLRSGAGNVAPKLSTQALDYVDRMLGDAAEGIRRGSGRTELAVGPSRAQARLRQVLDDATGLDKGRNLSAELRASEQALDFGRKAFANGTDLETMQREFARQSGKHGGDYIDPALLMGWMRGAEDAVEKATNPGTVIRQIYGSERQRKKLLAMLPTGEGLGSGSKADLTKRRRVLTGDKRPVPGRFDRERAMLDSENQIVGNSQTGQRNEAVKAQGGVQRAANAVADAIASPRQTAGKVIRHGIDRVTQPGIFKPAINRELGKIMFKGGKDELRQIVNKLEARQSHKLVRKSKLPKKKPAPSALPKKPAQAGFIDSGLIAKHPGVSGAVVGGALAQDTNDDGRVSLKERAIYAAGGAAGAKGAQSYIRGLNKSVARTVAKDGFNLSKLPGKAKSNGLPMDQASDLDAVAARMQTIKDPATMVDNLQVTTNPSLGQMRKLIQQNGGRPLRYQPTKDGDIFVWNADDSLHAPITARLKGEGIVPVPKDAGRISVKDGKLLFDGKPDISRLNASHYGAPKSNGIPPKKPAQAGLPSLNDVAKPISKGLQKLQRLAAKPTDPRHFAGTLAKADIQPPVSGQSAFDRARNPTALARTLANSAKPNRAASPGLESLDGLPSRMRGANSGDPDQMIVRSLERQKQQARKLSRESVGKTHEIKRRKAKMDAYRTELSGLHATVRRMQASPAGEQAGLQSILAQQPMLEKTLTALPGVSQKRAFEVVSKHIAELLQTGESTALTTRQIGTGKMLPRVTPEQALPENSRLLQGEWDRVNAPYTRSLKRGERMPVEAGLSTRRPNRTREMADLALNPARAQDAHDIARSGAKFDSFDKTGKVAAVAGGVGLGASIYSSATQDPRAKPEYEGADGDFVPAYGLKDYQAFLNAASYSSNAPYLDTSGKRLGEDGKWGKNTSIVIAHFQDVNGLPDTGELDNATVHALERKMLEAQARRLGVKLEAE